MEFHGVVFFFVVISAIALSFGHHWKEHGFIFFTPSLQVFIDPPEPPLQAEHSHISLLSFERCSSFFFIFVALCWTHLAVSLYFWYQAQHLPLRFATSGEERRSHLPELGCSAVAGGLLRFEGSLLSFGQLSVHEGNKEARFLNDFQKAHHRGLLIPFSCL